MIPSLFTMLYRSMLWLSTSYILQNSFTCNWKSPNYSDIWLCEIHMNELYCPQSYAAMVNKLARIYTAVSLQCPYTLCSRLKTCLILVSKAIHSWLWGRQRENQKCSNVPRHPWSVERETGHPRVTFACMCLESICHATVWPRIGSRWQITPLCICRQLQQQQLSKASAWPHPVDGQTTGGHPEFWESDFSGWFESRLVIIRVMAETVVTGVAC